MKYLLVLLVVGVGLYFLLGRSRKRVEPRPPTAPPPVGGPTRMLACAHCGVHLPDEDALRSATGEVFCSAAHRLAGPR